MVVSSCGEPLTVGKYWEAAGVAAGITGFLTTKITKNTKGAEREAGRQLT
jgi:hypothetical protein